MSRKKVKMTPEMLAEEGRFILANVVAEKRFSQKNTFDDLRRICEKAVSLPFSHYIGFLEAEGYLRRDAETTTLEATAEGELVANGADLGEFTKRGVAYFNSRRLPPAPTQPEQYEPGIRLATTAPREVPPRGVIDSRYEKVEKIGSGGIGTVYRARQVPLDREVALKEIRELFTAMSDVQRPEVVTRFAECVREAGRLRHVNILPLYDVNLECEFPFVVTELAVNGSVRKMLADATAKAIPLRTAIRYLLQTLRALAVAHKKGVFHCGLKPENLLLDECGDIKVSDFGHQRLVARDPAVVRQGYVQVGSVGYMAPELFNDPAATGAQADIYAAGIIFYELLTGKCPGRRSPWPSQANPSIPTAIDDIFDKMTRDSLAERYASVEEIARDLEHVDALADPPNKQRQAEVVNNTLDRHQGRGSPTAATTLVALRPLDNEPPNEADESDEADEATVVQQMETMKLPHS